MTDSYERAEIIKHKVLGNPLLGHQSQPPFQRGKPGGYRQGEVRTVFLPLLHYEKGICFQAIATVSTGCACKRLQQLFGWYLL